jgi:putative addiction module CopG family antidote
MEIRPTPDQQQFIRQAIESGRLSTADDAIREAMALWEQRERRRAEILLAVDDAEAAVARGEVRVITQQSMRELTEEVGQRGRARLAKMRQGN